MESSEARGMCLHVPVVCLCVGWGRGVMCGVLLCACATSREEVRVCQGSARIRGKAV